MSKQDVIREGMALLIPTDCNSCYLDGSKEIKSDCDDLEEPGSPCLLQLFLAKECLTYLHSQGVVIKVDRELPKNPVMVTDLFGLSKEEALSKNVANDCLVKLAQQDMLRAGCGFFEPLVEG